jgi:hypothetical protein
LEAIYGKKARKISKKWIEENRLLFREFLDETEFLDPERTGERGPKFQYPEWLIMLIAVLSVKLKIKTYIQIHRRAVAYRDQLTGGLQLKPISERQLRDRLKKSAIGGGPQKLDKVLSYMSDS